MKLAIDTGEIPLATAPGVTAALVSKRFALPDDLPLGYHEMTLEMAGERLASLAPDRLPEPGL